MAFVRFAALFFVALLLRDALFHAAGLPQAQTFFSWHKLAEFSSAVGIFWMLDAMTTQALAWTGRRSAAGGSSTP